MQGVQPPEQVQAAFDDAVKAGQDRERLKNEGQAYANDVIPKARGAASRLMQESEAYRASVVANSEGNAARFRQVLTEYQKAPAVTRDRLYLETMQQIFSTATTTPLPLVAPLPVVVAAQAAPLPAPARRQSIHCKPWKRNGPGIFDPAMVAIHVIGRHDNEQTSFVWNRRPDRAVATDVKPVRGRPAAVRHRVCAG